MHKRGVPVIYYVSPQLWAWKQGRIEAVRKYVREMLVIFPFEEKFYRERGIEAQFVGHPLADLPAPAITREQFAAEYKLDASRPWIALLPGSRRGGSLAHLPYPAGSGATSGPGLRLHSSSSIHARSELDVFISPRLRWAAGHVHQPCARDFAACPSSSRRQRHFYAGSRADRHAVHHGLSGGAAHLDARPPSS